MSENICGILAVFLGCSNSKMYPKRGVQMSCVYPRTCRMKSMHHNIHQWGCSSKASWHAVSLYVERTADWYQLAERTWRRSACADTSSLPGSSDQMSGSVVQHGNMITSRQRMVIKSVWSNRSRVSDTSLGLLREDIQYSWMQLNISSISVGSLVYS